MKKLPILIFLLTLLFACNLNSSKLVIEENGFQITFPCKYETLQGGYMCEESNKFSFSVKATRNWSSSALETRKKIYEGFISESSETKTGKINEKTINGFKILEFTENEFKDSKSSQNNLKSKKRYLDVYKDGILVEVTGSVWRSSDQSYEEFEQLLKTHFDSFFASADFDGQK